jgi:hypothetical protein
MNKYLNDNLIETNFQNIINFAASLEMAYAKDAINDLEKNKKLTSEQK